jgi:hypothetical protein
MASNLKAAWTRAQLWTRILGVALFGLIVTSAIYEQGVYADCGPGRPGGEACNIARSFGLLFALLAGMLVFVLGTITIGIVQWWRARRSRTV